MIIDSNNSDSTITPLSNLSREQVRDLLLSLHQEILAHIATMKETPDDATIPEGRALQTPEWNLKMNAMEAQRDRYIALYKNIKRERKADIEKERQAKANRASKQGDGGLFDFLSTFNPITYLTNEDGVPEYKKQNK